MSKRITLTPSAGFVVKTTNQEPGIYTPAALSEKQPSPNSLEPVLRSTPVTHGFKIFINVAFDRGVPPPPRSFEGDIRKSMAGDENAYFVPVVVSDGREVTDKVGKASLVFDAIFHDGLKERISKDLDFKTFIIEIALERVEEKTGLALGRGEITTPNLKAKGPLNERSALVPAYWTPAASSSKRPLIEEVGSSLPGPSSTARGKAPPPRSTSPKAPLGPPTWSLKIERTSTGTNSRSARIEVQIPLLTKADHAGTFLDLERNRLLLDCRPKYAALDVPILDAGDGILGLDIDNAKAEWSIKRGLLVIYAPIITQ